MNAETGRYSRVSRRMWNDAKVRQLSNPQPCGKFLFVWLLTIPDLSCIPGLFQAREAGLAEAIGWSLKGFRESFGELYRLGLAKADWAVGLVWLPNSIRHNEPANQKVVLHWAATWAELPECDLKWEAHKVLSAYCSERGVQFAESFARSCPYDSRYCLGGGTQYGSVNNMPNQEQEQEQKQKQEQEQDTKPPKRSKSQSREPMAETRLPPEWQPTTEHVAFAEKHGINLGREVFKFKAHYDGKLAKSWNGKFATWLARGVDFKEEREEKQASLPIGSNGRPMISAKDAGLPGM